MAKNAKISDLPMTDEEERLLEDGIFPFTFGRLDGPEEVRREQFELRRLAKEATGETLPETAESAAELLLWVQSIGTPGGYFLLQSLLAQSKLLQSACLRLSTHHPEFVLEVPFFGWLKANLRQWTAAVKSKQPGSVPLEIVVKSLRTWLNLDKAIGVVSGETPLSFRSARNGMVLLDKWLGGSEELALSVPRGGDPDAPACPLEAGLPIGTIAMARSAAHAARGLFTLAAEAEAREAARELEGGKIFRGSKFEIYPLGLLDKKLITQRPETEAPLRTYLAAHDLAAFTPLHPAFHRLRTGLRWDDLHPGHRLERALSVIRDKDLRIEAPDDKAYRRFTATICSALGWPEIQRFIDLARDHREEFPDDEAVTPMFLAAMEVREAHPTAFVDPFEASELLDDLAPPGVYLEQVESSRTADHALAFAFEAELYAMGFQLFFSAEPPKLVCPAYRTVIERLHPADELLKTYFGLEL